MFEGFNRIRNKIHEVATVLFYYSMKPCIPPLQNLLRYIFIHMLMSPSPFCHWITARL